MPEPYSLSRAPFCEKLVRHSDGDLVPRFLTFHMDLVLLLDTSLRIIADIKHFPGNPVDRRV